MKLPLSFIVIQQANAKLKNLFVKANFANLQAQLSKFEYQQALPQNNGKIMKKQQLFIFPKSPTIHHTSTLHNTFWQN